MKIKVFNADGSSAAEKEFPIPQFEGDKGLQALKQVILAVQANKRLPDGHGFSISNPYFRNVAIFRASDIYFIIFRYFFV